LQVCLDTFTVSRAYLYGAYPAFKPQHQSGLNLQVENAQRLRGNGILHM
jgi:hypothetical protein